MVVMEVDMTGRQKHLIDFVVFVCEKKNWMAGEFGKIVGVDVTR